MYVLSNALSNSPKFISLDLLNQTVFSANHGSFCRNTSLRDPVSHSELAAVTMRIWFMALSEPVSDFDLRRSSSFSPSHSKEVGANCSNFALMRMSTEPRVLFEAE